MQLRRSLSAGALVLALGGLTSCGFDLATDQPFTPGAGANDQDGPVDVLSALVVAAQPNGGTLVVSLVNNSGSEDASLSGVAGPGLEIGEFEAIELGPRDAVNLAIDGGIPVAGDFDAGRVLPMTLTFASGDTVDLNVPVVTACGAYLDLDLTEASDNIPYDCDFEPEPAGEHGGDDVDPAGGDAEDSE